jgi:hypothetical protein
MPWGAKMSDTGRLLVAKGGCRVPGLLGARISRVSTRGDCGDFGLARDANERTVRRAFLDKVCVVVVAVGCSTVAAACLDGGEGGCCGDRGLRTRVLRLPKDLCDFGIGGGLQGACVAFHSLSLLLGDGDNVAGAEGGW